MDTWEIAILKSIQQLGGEADNQEIYKELPDFRELTEKHRRISQWDDVPAFYHQVRAHLAKLRQAGDLCLVAPGRNSLTISGKARITP